MFKRAAKARKRDGASLFSEATGIASDRIDPYLLGHFA
jgi:hypothetical protein